MGPRITLQKKNAWLPFHSLFLFLLCNLLLMKLMQSINANYSFYLHICIFYIKYSHTHTYSYLILYLHITSRGGNRNTGKIFKIIYFLETKGKKNAPYMNIYDHTHKSKMVIYGRPYFQKLF